MGLAVQNASMLAARVETLEGDLELQKEAHKSEIDAMNAELASVQEASPNIVGSSQTGHQGGNNPLCRVL